jgi:hypothetical protein
VRNPMFLRRATGSPVAVFLAVLVPLLAAGPASAALLNLSGWNSVAYSGTASTNTSPVWALQPGDTQVNQTANSETTVFVSDFSIDQTIVSQISGTFQSTGSDDDQIGFVFGVQDTTATSLDMYLFQWKASNPEKIGASLRRLVDVDIYSNPPDNPDDAFEVRMPTTPGVTVLQIVEDLAWTMNELYTFDVAFNGGGFNILVRDSMMAEIINWDIADTTFTSGKIGFYGSSQSANYTMNSFQPVPVPPAALLFMSALGLLGWVRQRFTAR